MKCKICKGFTHLYLKKLYDDRYGATGFHDIYRCENCGYAVTYPGIGKDQIGKFYAQHYPLASYSVGDIKNYATIPSKFTAWLKGINNTCHWYIKRKRKVLDIGSGTGVSLLEIKKMGGIGFGVEPDPNAQKTAKKLSLKVFQGFITDNPFPHTKFDYITASQVIEHDPDPINFLKNAKNKLNSGGEIILSFPNIDSIYQKMFKKKWLNWHVPYHLSFLTRRSLEVAAKKAGLKIKKIRTITPNLWTVLQLRMLIASISHGRPNPIWVSTAKRNIKKENHDIKTSLLKKSLSLVILLLSIMNRVIDAAGLGDSFLVFLADKNE